MIEYGSRIFLERGDAEGIVLAEGHRQRRLPWAAIASVAVSASNFGGGRLTLVSVGLVEPDGSRRTVSVSEIEPGYATFLRHLCEALPELPAPETWLARLSARAQPLQIYSRG